MQMAPLWMDQLPLHPGDLSHRPWPLHSDGALRPLSLEPQEPPVPGPPELGRGPRAEEPVSVARLRILPDLGNSGRGLGRVQVPCASPLWVPHFSCGFHRREVDIERVPGGRNPRKGWSTQPLSTNGVPGAVPTHSNTPGQGLHSPGVQGVGKEERDREEGLESISLF